MKITVLGSGTSFGVPVIGKSTPVNLSEDPKDKRLRSSIFIEGDHPIIIDTGPDFRMQVLTNHIDNVSHVLLTHSHYDHIGGFDDLRALCAKNPDGISCYSDEFTHKEIIGRYHYFYADDEYFGKPKINFYVLPVNENGIFTCFHIGDTRIQPVKLVHIRSKQLYSVGYVINGKIAYLTDFREILDEYIEFLYDLELLIIGAPLPDPHPNHLSIYEAVELIKKLKARQGIISHLADEKFHFELENELPDHIRPAFDGLILKI